ncbi:DUF6438 domain-containing protein [Chitinophaga vietnamensis]|uniref:DUF6438 domain-containing protein n=1 Tax=Chitinophaga vietnamensis TaxID=2593957 RepID=UPI00117793BC|nr:DUF6438 domain-containing protein [Chitinophaga vietnamensis]
MKSSLLLIVFLLVSVAGFSNKIDSLQTIKEAIQFINTLGYHLNDDTTASFIKIDLDGNKLTDLLIKGNPLTIVMDKGKDGYQVQRLSPPDFNFIYKLQQIDSSDTAKRLLLKKALKPQFEYYLKETPDTSLKKLLSLNYSDSLYANRIDTMVYQFGHFIEYTAAPAKYKIKSIRLTTTTCFGVCPEYNMTIHSNRKAKYNAGIFTEESGYFSGVIDEHSYQELMELINYIHIRSLHDNYSIKSTDSPTVYLKIVFEDGKKKSIRDYGKRGTFGLRALYQFIDGLRTSQKWVATH